MKSKLRVALAAAGCALAVSAGTSTVRADTVYSWQFTDGANFGHGTITIGGLDANQTQHQGGNDVTGITGGWDGFTINTLTVFNGGDNVFYPTGCSTASGQCSGAGLFLDNEGLSFSLIGSTNQVNIFDSFGYADNFGGNSHFGAQFFAFAAPVPGPIAGAGPPGLMLAGGGLLGWWRRKRKADAAA